jgi:hypothetical protein
MSISPTASFSSSAFAPTPGTSPADVVSTQNKVLHAQIGTYVEKDQINLSKAAVALIANGAATAAASQEAQQK